MHVQSNAGCCAGAWEEKRASSAQVASSLAGPMSSDYNPSSRTDPLLASPFNGLSDSTASRNRRRSTATSQSPNTIALQADYVGGVRFNSTSFRQTQPLAATTGRRWWHSRIMKRSFHVGVHPIMAAAQGLRIRTFPEIFERRKRST